MHAAFEVVFVGPPSQYSLRTGCSAEHSRIVAAKRGSTCFWNEDSGRGCIQGPQCDESVQKGGRRSVPGAMPLTLLGGPFDLVTRVSKVGYGGL